MAFPNDVVSLIKLVEARPCLWDKYCEYFRDKPTRHKAWIEIYHFLEKNYDELTNKEKKQVGKCAVIVRLSYPTVGQRLRTFP